MTAYIRDAQWTRVADQLTQHPPAGRQWPDRAAHVLVDAERQESGEVIARLIEYPQRGVPRVAEPAGGLQHPNEDHLEVKLLQNASGDAENGFGG
jgi:hypothetical protein